MKLYPLLLLFCFCMLSTDAIAQEDVSSKLIAQLEKSNAQLEKQALELTLELEKLRKENRQLTLRLKRLEFKARDSEKNGAVSPRDTDLLATGSKWRGELHGVDASGAEFHNAATATIVSRAENAFRIHAVIQSVEWSYDCVADKRRKNLYYIDRAVLDKAPQGFPSDPGEILINDSEITFRNVRGTQVLEIMIERPIKGSSIRAIYILSRE